MMRIPQSFQLLGHTITVRVIPANEWTALMEPREAVEAFGYWDYDEHLIYVKENRASMMAHTFCHEMTHAILDLMNHALSEDEVFVDNFSGLLAQAIDSGSAE